MTSSNGRGAKEDQCSYLDCAISAHMPLKHGSNKPQELISTHMLAVIHEQNFAEYASHIL
jgi:hypothetical protein